MTSLIIRLAFGGLGDSLFYSAVPRLAKASGRFDRVYVSARSPFRSAETRRLVWELNPYVDGIVEDEGVSVLPRNPLPEGVNIVDEAAIGYGVDDGERFKEPEVYYVPHQYAELRDVVLYDPNFISLEGALDRRAIRDFFQAEGVFPTHQMVSRGRNLSLSGVPTTIAAHDLFYFCDILASVKAIYCLTTGTATLAAALGVRATVLQGQGVGAFTRHSRNNTYVQLALPSWRYWLWEKRLSLRHYREGARRRWREWKSRHRA